MHVTGLVQWKLSRRGVDKAHHELAIWGGQPVPAGDCWQRVGRPGQPAHGWPLAGNLQRPAISGASTTRPEAWSFICSTSNTILTIAQSAATRLANCFLSIQKIRVHHRVNQEAPNRPATDDTMPPSLLHPPSQLSPSAALQLSQQAPNVLSESLSAVSSSPFSLFSAAETPELWIKYENLLLSCLRTGDERAAHECLERLTTRFGKTNERVMALSGLVKEADAQNPDDLEIVLKEYDEVLSEDSANIVRCPRGPESMHPSR